MNKRRETKFIYRIYLGPPPRDDPEDDELPLPIEELPPLEPRVGLEIELDEKFLDGVDVELFIDELPGFAYDLVETPEPEDLTILLELPFPLNLQPALLL